MSSRNDLSVFFEKAFADFERNRMYPPNYGKEPPMTKLKYDHISAITNCQQLLETSVNVDGSPKLRNAVTRDIKLLCELRDILFFALENPTLPFNIPQPDKLQPILNRIEAEPNGAF